MAIRLAYCAFYMRALLLTCFLVILIYVGCNRAEDALLPIHSLITTYCYGFEYATFCPCVFVYHLIDLIQLLGEGAEHAVLCKSNLSGVAGILFQVTCPPSSENAFSDGVVLVFTWTRITGLVRTPRVAPERQPGL